MKQGFTQHGRLWNGIHELVDNSKGMLFLSKRVAPPKNTSAQYIRANLRGLVMFRVYSGAFTSLLNQEQRGNVYRDAMALANYYFRVSVLGPIVRVHCLLCV